MLSIRQHLNECAECNFEYESLLRVKRAFGSLSPKAPAPALAERIYLRLDELAETPQEHVLTSLRKRMTIVHGRLGFAAAAVGVIAMLLTLRSGPIYNASNSFLPQPKQIEVANIGSGDPGTLFPAISHVAAAHLASPPPAPANPWDVQQDGTGQVGSAMLVSYNTIR